MHCDERWPDGEGRPSYDELLACVRRCAAALADCAEGDCLLSDHYDVLAQAETLLGRNGERPLTLAELEREASDVERGALNKEEIT